MGNLMIPGISDLFFESLDDLVQPETKLLRESCGVFKIFRIYHLLGTPGSIRVEIPGVYRNMVRFTYPPTLRSAWRTSESRGWGNCQIPVVSTVFSSPKWPSENSSLFMTVLDFPQQNQKKNNSKKNNNSNLIPFSCPKKSRSFESLQIF